jgi:hypothetical protein
MAVILIPYRGSPDRQILLDRVFTHLSPLNLPIFHGDSDTAIFSLSRAFNAAAENAGPWARAILSEADAFVPLDQIRAALSLPDPLVYCYDSHLKLTRTETATFLATGLLPSRAPIPAASTHGSNGIRVISRDLWDQLGGYDPAFIGWGAEDNDFIYRAEELTTPTRIPGPMYELHHSRDPIYFSARGANREYLKWKWGT